jgi:hypothetical protein
MAKLTTAKKKAEPNKEFGLPEQRKYPMPDASHARNAKARASQMDVLQISRVAKPRRWSLALRSDYAARPRVALMN